MGGFLLSVRRPSQLQDRCGFWPSCHFSSATCCLTVLLVSLRHAPRCLQGHCWVLADNEQLAPPHVIDSRSFGPLPLDTIVGRWVVG
jgi:hypothetical protein